LRFDYRTRDGELSRREVEPYSVVRVGSRWYVFAWDPMREGWRSFRVDRMVMKAPAGTRFTRRELPPGGATQFVAESIRHAFAQVRAKVRLHAPIEHVTPLVRAEWAMVESNDVDSCLVTINGESLEAIAQWLAHFDAAFTVVDPPDLRAACRQVAARHNVLAARYRDA
jgi:predicted DNA-binding transcriptional regulator YafY